MGIRQMLPVAVILAFAAPSAQERSPATPHAKTEQDARRVIHGKAYGDTIGLTQAQTNWTLEHAVVEASPRTGIIFYDKVGAHRGTILRDVLIHVAPGKIPLDRSYWAFRGYDMVDTLFHRVEITGFGRVTEKHDEGHAIYVNPAGDFTLLDSYFHHNGGQGLQLVNRPNETSMGKGPMPGVIAIHGTRFHENGFNPNRGAFQVSIFGTGQRIVMRDVEIIAGFDETVWPNDQTGGALVIEAEPYDPGRKRYPWWRPENPPPDFVPPFTQGVTELTRVTIRHRNPNRPLVQIKGCAELIVRECTFDGPTVEGVEGFARVVLDAPDKPGRESGRIVWKGNHGNAVVFHKGQRLGLACEDFVIEPEEPTSKHPSR